MQSTLALVSAITAVIVGPLISLRIARNRARFEAIVLERVESIRDLRKAYSEFIAYLMIANADRGLGKLSHVEASQKLERAFRLETELSLMLDAEKKQDRIVLENITEARNRVFKIWTPFTIRIGGKGITTPRTQLYLSYSKLNEKK